jgi:sugar O-acyltransferase (sialic acid O-acetyltransferase NeuD family)
MQMARADWGLMRIGILGAGGHAKVVADAIQAAGRHYVAGFFDDDPLRHGKVCFGFPVLGAIDAWRSHSIDSLVVGIGDNRKRKLQYNRLIAAGANLTTVVHPATTIGRGVELGSGTVVFAGVVVNCDTIVGPNNILNTSCSVDHDCVTGGHSHIAPGANLAGQVRLGEGVFIGLGAKLIPGIVVEDWAIVGAGAVVIRDVAKDSKVAGVPARIIKGGG